jgi:hypothetical protein
MFRVPPADMLISTASRGSWVGEAVLLGHDQRRQTVTVQQRSVVLHPPQPAFLSLIADTENGQHYCWPLF